MYENRNWYFKNICIEDSHNLKFDYFQGDHCFIIGNHLKEKSIIEEAADKLVKGAFNYYNIFGQQANLWEEAIYSKANHRRQIHLESNNVDSVKMTYDLAMLSMIKPKSINFLISDDEFFTEYLIKDLYVILSGKSRFTPFDWQKFRSGYEFIYNCKDAIISISDDILIGYLGQEKIFKNSYKAFSYKLFDGKDFYEIWKDISKD